MSILTLREIKNIIESSGLNAQFRVDCKNEWSDVVEQGSDVPALYMEHLVDYQTVHFHGISDSSTDISLIFFHDKSPCGVWPLIIDVNDKEPIKSINNQYGGVVVPPLFIENFPKKSQRRVVKSCIEFLNKLLAVSCGECWRTNEVSATGGISQWHQIGLEKLD